LRDVEGQEGADAGVFRVELELVFGFGGGGVVAERGDATGDVGPDRAEGEEVFLVDERIRLADADRMIGVERADVVRAGIETVRAENGEDVIAVGGADLKDGAEFFVEEGGELRVEG